MALIFCPECGTQVSQYAQQCVKCAYPIKNRLTPESDIQTENNLNSYEATNVNNTTVWILAFAPLIGIFLQSFLYGFMTSITNNFYSYNKFWWATLILNVFLCYLDESGLKKSGIDTSKINSWAIWIVPVYLYKRAEILKQSQSYFWVWLIVFFITIFL